MLYNIKSICCLSNAFYMIDYMYPSLEIFDLMINITTTQKVF